MTRVRICLRNDEDSLFLSRPSRFTNLLPFHPMPRVFVSVVDQIQTLRLAWRKYSPDAVISGMTLAEFEAATAEPLDLRKEISRLNIELSSARAKRDDADLATRKLVESVVYAIKGMPENGGNSVFYGLLGYVRDSEKKTGKVRRKRQTPPNLEVI